MFATGGARVAVLDIDFHHGNGTQDIFYRRGDVFFASLHGAPEDAYPYYLGYADEAGEGPGEGTNLNLPMLPERATARGRRLWTTRSSRSESGGPTRWSSRWAWTPTRTTRSAS